MRISKSKITSSTITASAGRILYFNCPICHNKAVVDMDNEVYRDIDMGYHDRCICEECGAELLAEPQYRGDPKFISIDEDDDIYSSVNSDDSHYKNGYRYITKHGLGPGTLPKDVHLLHAEDLPNWKTAIWLDRFLTTDELKYYDIYPEWIQSSTDVKSSKVVGAVDSEIDNITDAISRAARDFMMSPSVGFPEDEVDDYLFIETAAQDDYIRIEVRAELNYDTMMDLIVELDKVIAQYDSDAYFDMDEPGIASAYVSKSLVNGSVTGSYGIENARILHLAKTPEPELKDRNSVWIQVKDDYDLETYFRSGLRMGPDTIVIHDFDVDEIPGGLLTLARSAEIPVKFASKSRSVGAATNTSNVLVSEDVDLDEVESASYGGAYDIEDDMFFTRDEINEFGYDVADLFSAWADSTFDLSDVYMDTPTKLHIEVSNKEYEEYSADIKIDMRRIRIPKDLYKYEDAVLRQLKDAYLDYHAADDEEYGWNAEPIQSAEDTSDVNIDGEDVIYAYDKYYVPDRPLEPPYEPELPVEEDVEIVKVHLDDNISILEDGSWSYSTETGDNPDYRNILNISNAELDQDSLKSSTYSQLTLDTESSLVEHVDDLLSDRLPADPGLYHVTADIDLHYDINYPDINEYNEDKWSSYVVSEFYSAEFNYYESEVIDLTFEKID